MEQVNYATLHQIDPFPVRFVTPFNSEQQLKSISEMKSSKCRKFYIFFLRCWWNNKSKIFKLFLGFFSFTNTPRQKHLFETIYFLITNFVRLYGDDIRDWNCLESVGADRHLTFDKKAKISVVKRGDACQLGLSKISAGSDM